MKTNHLLLILLGVQLLATGCILDTLSPTLKEKYIAIQTVELEGKKYVCGTVLDNKDEKSLYCTGFTDGYSWAVQQMKMDDDFSKLK